MAIGRFAGASWSMSAATPSAKMQGGLFGHVFSEMSVRVLSYRLALEQHHYRSSATYPTWTAPGVAVAGSTTTFAAGMFTPVSPSLQSISQSMSALSQQQLDELSKAQMAAQQSKLGTESWWGKKKFK